MAINKVDSGHFMVDFRDQSRKRLQKTFRTHREAKAFQKAVLAQVEAREYIKPSTKAIRDLAEEWYQKKVDSATYRRASLEQWRNHIEKYINPELGSIKVDGITVSAIEKAAAAWAEDVSPKTSNKMLTTLSAIFAMAKRYDWRRDNPAQDAERLKVATEEESTLEVEPDKVYTGAEIKTLIDSTEPGSRDRALVMILALTGIRIGELLALDWDAVDLKNAKLHVRLNLADSGAGEDPLFQAPKTKSSKRTIPLPKELVKELMAWKLRSNKSERKLVFATEEGNPHHRRAMGKFLERIIKKAELKKQLTAHGFRHTFASLLLQSRVAITEVSHLLGHKDSSITLRVYAHFVREETGAVQNLAASILGSGV